MSKLSIIEVKNYSFAYEDAPVLQDVSFAIEAGTLTAIIGLSGCGKTTLCHAITGVIPHCIDGQGSGSITVCGLDTAAEKLPVIAQRIGLVMQDPDDQLVTTAVEDELAFAPENLALPVSEIRERVDRVSALLGLEELRQRDPNSLSGGQKRIVAIGAVLTLDPEIIVLDEPMSHLDAAGQKLIAETFERLRGAGKTVVVVEHNFKTMTNSDKWLIISGGGIAAYASPAEILADEEILKKEKLV